MSIYLDASVLVPVFLSDEFTDRSENLLVSDAKLLISDFAAAEFSAVVAKAFRKKLITGVTASSIFAGFDDIRGDFSVAIFATERDLSRAEELVRMLETKLRAPDALHLAIAERLRAKLATFDQTLAEAARTVGVTLAEL